MDAFPLKVIDYNQDLTPYNDIATETKRITPSKRCGWQLRSKGIIVNTIFLKERCSLWMQDSVIKDIYVRGRANLNLDHCKITGKLVTSPFAYEVSIENSKLNEVKICPRGDEFTHK